MATPTKTKTYKNYQEYLDSPEWKRLRKKTIQRVKKEYGAESCEMCGLEDEQFNVHHWKYPKDWSNDNEDYHVLLCRDCHEKWHTKYEKASYEAMSRNEFLRTFNLLRNDAFVSIIDIERGCNNKTLNTILKLVQEGKLDYVSKFNVEKNKFCGDFYLSGVPLNSRAGYRINEIFIGQNEAEERGY